MELGAWKFVIGIYITFHVEEPYKHICNWIQRFVSFALY